MAENFNFSTTRKSLERRPVYTILKNAYAKSNANIPKFCVANKEGDGFILTIALNSIITSCLSRIDDLE